MFDILTAFLGPRVCAWCTQRDVAAYRWFYNHVVPKRLARALGPYDSWVGRVGGGWHHRHHVHD
jgi:hypothetical protein